MTDMHREGFESETKFATYARDGRYPNYYGNPVVQGAWEGWQAAIRYRDEQTHFECAYTCKFCRDEQEKQA